MLGEVDGVSEVAVFGLPDDRWGERVCAAVVPATRLPPASTRALIDEVGGHASAHLAGYKRPKQYVVLAALPRTATGKVQRSVIPDLLDQE